MAEWRGFVLVVVATFGVAQACSDDSGGGEGGSSGKAGSSGTGATGGSGTGGASGSGGSDSGASSEPVLGTVGSGEVECYGIEAGTCASGMACCVRFPFGDNSCEATIEACGCRGKWDDCTVHACQGPEDCTSGQCCATKNPYVGGPEFAASSCKPSCAPDVDEIVCSSNADCPVGGECLQSSQDFKRCF